MASSANWFETKRKAYKLRTKVLTTSAALTTYTTRAGGASDSFIIDRVILVTTTNGNNMDITVTDGVYPGQELLVVFVSEANVETIITDVDTGDDGTTLTAASGYTILLWIDDTNGWVEKAASAT